MLLPPVPTRECGPCNVCCKLPTILDPALKKHPGVLCPHWAAGTGCTIYEQRPGPCRGHFCAWRRIEQFDDSWRPDIFGVYAEVKTEPYERFRHVLPDAAFALKFTILEKLDTRRMELLIATIASLIESDVPVVLAVTAPPNHMGGYRLLNPDLRPLVATGEGVLEKFAQLLQSLIETPPTLVSLD